jgi:hypothetical protein
VGLTTYLQTRGASMGSHWALILCTSVALMHVFANFVPVEFSIIGTLITEFYFFQLIAGILNWTFSGN